MYLQSNINPESSKEKPVIGPEVYGLFPLEEICRQTYRNTGSFKLRAYSVENRLHSLLAHVLPCGPCRDSGVYKKGELSKVYSYTCRVVEL